MDFIFEYRGSEFEWDVEKAVSNFQKHGVSFETACEVFFDPLARHGDASVETEQRNIIIGKTHDQDLLFTIYVERGLRSRIISARLATRPERKSYHASNRDQFN